MTLTPAITGGAIELKERWMGPNVNPLASRDAKIMPLAMGNARASQAPSQGGDGDFVYAFNNYQYVDIYNFWGGSSGEGPIAIPSPELIDAGHRNGVPVTGTIFLPWGDGAYGNQFVSEMVEKDENGHFPRADKLVEIAQYYGFDGYIFNAESGTGVAGFKRIPGVHPRDQAGSLYHYLVQWLRQRWHRLHQELDAGRRYPDHRRVVVGYERRRLYGRQRFKPPRQPA